MTILIILIVSCLIARGFVVQAYDPIKDQCIRWHHQSTIKNGFLYIDGGVEIFKKSGETVLGYNQRLLRIDVRNSWTPGDNTTRYSGIDKRFANPKPPSLVRGALYQGPPNDTRLYTYGGTTFLANTSFPNWTPQISEPSTIWGYGTFADTWSSYDIKDKAPRRPNRGSYAEAPALGLAFYLNGQLDAGSSQDTALLGNTTQYLDGMVIFNTVHNCAMNITTISLGTPRVAGGLVYIEGVGANGALVAVGGMQRGGSGTRNELISFDHVHLCDDFTENSTWYHQATTGDVPPPRSDFCMVSAPALDKSSHNIYMYGGIDVTSENRRMFDDVYILSLPSFTWTRTDSPGNSSRWGHTCHITKDRQMLVVDGSVDSSLYDIETTAQQVILSSITCAGHLDEMAVLDLTTLQWGSMFNLPEHPYEVPDAIVSRIGGGGKGGATITAPLGGFAEAAVSQMFYPGPTSSQNTTTEKTKHHVSRTSLIAGTLVGGLCGLCVLIGFIFYMLRRKRLRANEGTSGIITKTTTHTSSEMTNDSMVQEMGGASRMQEMAVDITVQELHARATRAELE